MTKVIKKAIDVAKSFKKGLAIICDFCNTTPTIIKGSIKRLEKTNFLISNRIERLSKKIF